MYIEITIMYREYAKYDSKLDFKCKTIPKFESNAKLIQKSCEITTNLL